MNAAGRGEDAVAFHLPPDLPAVANEGACATATHVVTGLSVGAYRLVAGGSVRAAAGAGFTNAGAGTSTQREEVTLREAGDFKACGEGDKEPSAACRSPIQVFLQPLPNRGAAAGLRVEQAEGPPVPGAVRVNFVASSAAEHWTLLDSKDAFVCDLPCTRWVPPKSGMKVKFDAPKVSEIEVVELPADLGYSPGRTIDATPKTERCCGTAGFVFLVLGGAFLMPGVPLLVVGATGNVNGGTGDPGPAIAAGGTLLGLGAGTTLAGLLLFVPSRKSGVDLRLADEPRTSGVHLRLDPRGIAGEF